MLLWLIVVSAAAVFAASVLAVNATASIIRLVVVVFAFNMCLHPITIKNKAPNARNFTAYIEVPCGKCYECVMKKRFQWCFRLSQELIKSKKHCFFVTLTYDNDHLPHKQVLEYVDKQNHCHFVRIPCFDRVHIRNFVRAMRDKFRYECKKKGLNSSDFTSFKYFATSEYGYKSLRPHYHVLFFDMPFDLDEFRQILSNFWNFGKVFTLSANENMIWYTCKYILKQDWITVPGLHKSSDRNFMLCSKSIGLCFLTDEMIDFIRNQFYDRGDLRVRFQGKKVVLPRYYRDKVFSPMERIFVADKLIENYDRYKNCPETADPVDWLQHRISKHFRKVLENCELEIC